MDIKELKKIISRGEDSFHQFKEDVRNHDSLAAEMVAFSNFRGGRLFIGVSNKGELVGLSSKDVDRINQLISSSASQHVRSPITIHTENISVGSDRIVIVLTIPDGIDKPYFDNQGVIWLKSGADKRRIHSKEELRRLFQEVDLLHADEIPTKAGVEAVNKQLLSTFLKDVYHTTLPASNAESLQLLENMNLASNDRLNLAGLLLFGDNPQIYKPQFIIKAASFFGTEPTNSYLDSEDFEGSLSSMFQGALAFIMRHLHKVQNQKSVNSLGDPEIPRAVFEEILVNALIHRDYFISAPVRLFVFHDRIEIISPGHLPDHLTIEKIRAGNSIQRNPILASFVAKGLLPYRGLGTGVRRALQDWPQITFIDDHDGCLFSSIIQRVPIKEPLNKGSLRALKVHPKPKTVALKVHAEPLNVVSHELLSNLQQNILDVLHKDATASYESLSTQFDVSRTTIMRNIQKLKESGVLSRSGSKKTGHWETHSKHCHSS